MYGSVQPRPPGITESPPVQPEIFRGNFGSKSSDNGTGPRKERGCQVRRQRKTPRPFLEGSRGVEPTGIFEGDE
jgi:hypothetical protein